MGLCALGAGLGACGSSSSANGVHYGTAPVVPALQTPAGTHASRIVRLRNLAFNPNVVHIRVGQTIKWVNRDTVVHNVTSSDGVTIQSNNFAPGHSFEFTAKQPGILTYYCTIHPTTMQASIVVLRQGAR